MTEKCCKLEKNESLVCHDCLSMDSVRDLYDKEMEDMGLDRDPYADRLVKCDKCGYVASYSEFDNTLPLEVT